MTVTVVDEKNRPVVQRMTEREMLEEILATMRGVTDAIEVISQNPLLSAMIPNLPKF